MCQVYFVGVLFVLRYQNKSWIQLKLAVLKRNMLSEYRRIEMQRERKEEREVKGKRQGRERNRMGERKIKRQRDGEEEGKERGRKGEKREEGREKKAKEWERNML